MSERYTVPKESWFVPFGPIRGVDLVKVAALTRYREATKATRSHGAHLLRVEEMFTRSARVTSQIHEMKEGVEYYLRGLPTSETSPDCPGVLMIVRDGAIISIKQVNRHDWQTMPG